MFLALLLQSFASTPTANPGRPSFSDNASPTATGAMELEAGGVVDPLRVGLNYVLKYGINSRFDLRLGFDHSLTPSFAPGTFSLLMKGTIQKPRERVMGVAIAPYLGYQPGATKPGFGSYVIVTYPQGDLQIDANLLLDMVPDGVRYNLQLDPVVTFSFPLAGKLGGYAESYMIIPTGGNVQPGIALAAGLGYEARKNIVIDAAADFGLVNQDLISPWKVQVGATFSGYLKEPKNDNKNNNGKKKKKNTDTLR